MFEHHLARLPGPPPPTLLELARGVRHDPRILYEIPNLTKFQARFRIPTQDSRFQAKFRIPDIQLQLAKELAVKSSIIL